MLKVEVTVMVDVFVMGNFGQRGRKSTKAIMMFCDRREPCRGEPWGGVWCVRR